MLWQPPQWGMRFRQEARRQHTARDAKITALYRGTCDVQLPTGATIKRVHFASGNTWPIGTWVKIERVGADWQVIGIGSSFTEVYVAPTPGEFLVPGIWDQTWRSHYQDARSSTTTAPADLTLDDAWEYDSDADGGGIHWAPEGLLAHKTGRVYHVSRWTDIAESGVNALELRVRLLVPSSGTWAVQCSGALALVDDEQTVDWLLPDGTAFYNSADDVLTILVAPTNNTLTDGSARIWTLQPNEDLDGFVSAVSSFALGDEGERRGWGIVGQAGRRMIRLDLLENEEAGYLLDLETLEWSEEWLSTPMSGSLHSHYSAPGWISQGARRNYSPPYTNGRFYTLVCVREGTGEAPNWSNYRLRERAINPATGEATDIDIYSWDAVDRSDPVRLSICDDYADAWLLDLQTGLGIDNRVPATGTYTETSSEHSITRQDIGTGEEWTYSWTQRVTKRWLGACYEDYEHSWSSGGPSTNYPSMHFPVANSGVPNQPGALTSNIGGVPLGPPGTPVPFPNRSWFGRIFWTGQGATFGSGIEEIPWSVLAMSGAYIPYSAAIHCRESQARGIATADGWRFWVAIVPDQPVFVPNTLDKDGAYTNPYPYIVDNTFSDLVLANSIVVTGTLGTTVDFGERGEYRYLSGVVPVVRWTWQTRLFAVSPSGEKFERELSGRFTGIQYPGKLTDGEVEILTIAEELAVAENCYQLFTVPRHNLLGILMDQRTSATADPEPMVLLLDRTDNAFSEVYRIPASEFFAEECLEIVDADAEYDGQHWKRVGQYAYTLHGADESGPLCKLIERADETLLVIGTEAVERVEPSTGTPGETRANLSLLRLNALDYDNLSGVGQATEWTWGTSREGVGYLGPRGVRSAVVISDRIAIGAQLTDGPGLREIK